MGMMDWKRQMKNVQGSKWGIPKKGKERPTTKVESTSPVLIKIEYMRDLSDGTSSSRLIATGDIVNAYVILLIKERHM